MSDGDFSCASAARCSTVIFVGHIMNTISIVERPAPSLDVPHSYSGEQLRPLGDRERRLALRAALVPGEDAGDA
jgi:hypothetical protein